MKYTLIQHDPNIQEYGSYAVTIIYCEVPQRTWMCEKTDMEMRNTDLEPIQVGVTSQGWGGVVDGLCIEESGGQ